MKERRFGFREENLLSPARALAAFFAAVTVAPPRLERVLLDDAFGRVLASPVVADRDYPDAPRSAMDGFTIYSSSVPGTLQIAGAIAMGAAWEGSFLRGTAVRIPTGGIVPDGADAVVPIEDVLETGGAIDVTAAIAAGENVNPRAGDMSFGELVLSPGIRIGGPALGVLATLGIVKVPVFRRPVIAVISSGDELVPPESEPPIGSIRDSNRYAVAGSLSAMGAIPRHVPTVRDEPGALRDALARALEWADAAILTGGSSVGERDRTPEAVAALGSPGVIVHGLRVKPGKPTVLAAMGGKPVIGLPGNPTSALMILEAVASPIVRSLTGEIAAGGDVTAVLDAAVRTRIGWTWFVPVALRHEGEALVAHPLSLRSSTVSLTARAGGYLTVADDVDELAAGCAVRVRYFA